MSARQAWRSTLGAAQTTSSSAAPGRPRAAASASSVGVSSISVSARCTQRSAEQAAPRSVWYLPPAAASMPGTSSTAVQGSSASASRAAQERTPMPISRSSMSSSWPLRRWWLRW